MGVIETPVPRFDIPVEVWQVSEEAVAVWVNNKASFWLDEYGTAYAIAKYGNQPLYQHDPATAALVETLVALYLGDDQIRW